MVRSISITETNRLLVEEHHRPPISYDITKNGPINEPMAGYLLGVFPVGREGWREASLAYKNILQGHILTYCTVDRIYRERNWSRLMVTVNTWVAAPCSFDKIAPDLFLARVAGVSRKGVLSMFSEQCERLRARLADCPCLHDPKWFKRQLDRAADRTIWKAMSPMERPSTRFSQFPVGLRMAGERDTHSSAGTRCVPPNGRQPSLSACQLSQSQPGTERSHTQQVRSIRAVRRLQSFYYWSLVDNYEWGNYEPRFGLFGVDCANGARRLPVDVAGSNAAGAFRLFVEAFHAQERPAVREAFRTENILNIQIVIPLFGAPFLPCFTASLSCLILLPQRGWA